ncbi:MAG: diguanylate cyclase [Janthinobacterium lividum]
MTSPSVSSAPDLAAQRRGALLRELQLLDDAPIPELDDLVTLTTLICDMPMGAVTLLDETTLTTRARIGLSGSTTVPVGDSMCQYTIQDNRLMMVEDLQEQSNMHYADVWLQAGIRFYAGMPLLSEDGTAIGALCVMDSKPSTLTAEQQMVMAILSRQVSRTLQTRTHARAMERMAAERDREQKMFNLVLDHVPISIYLKDDKGRFCFYNAALAERFRVDRKAWMGKTNHDLWDRELADSLKLKEDAVLTTGLPQVTSVDVPEPNGTVSHWKTYEIRCVNMAGEPMLAGSAIDLTEQMLREAELQRTRDELQEANRKLSSLALTDSLTGLWNRRAFDARLETSIMSAHRAKQPLTLMLIDVDHFKRVNDQHGHPFGDSVLKEIAEVLNGVKRGEDVACRFGGEEFAVLLPGTDINAAYNLADRMLKATRNFPWKKTPVTVSIGLAMYMDHGLSDELVDQADAALYQAKHAGRDRVILYKAPPAT